MNFLALDVETANADYSSICQIGIAEFQEGAVVNKWSTLVNPESYFDAMNISIHGITEDDVIDAPTFAELHSILNEKLSGRITVHHMPFDRVAISRACEGNGLEIIEALWLDSAKIVRRTWTEFAHRGYGLANIAAHLDIRFGHHDALEDAVAAGMVVCRACSEKALSIEDWANQVNRPVFVHGGTNGKTTDVKLDGNPEGPLFGETMVFTGELTLSRSEAARIAADLGCNVGSSVNKKTTILVVGTQDSSKLAGYTKSSKHRRAEEMIGAGVPVRILSEGDFVEMCNLT
ncbi:MAG TPA: exonuclease domain-containing protein [Bacteroidales bacterium]|nr:exonuclease domain-containing protein [Bacteroidales bacterium]